MEQNGQANMNQGNFSSVKGNTKVGNLDWHEVNEFNLVQNLIKNSRNICLIQWEDLLERDFYFAEIFLMLNLFIQTFLKKLHHMLNQNFLVQILNTLHAC